MIGHLLDDAERDIAALRHPPGNERIADAYVRLLEEQVEDALEALGRPWKVKRKGLHEKKRLSGREIRAVIRSA
ncbi:MAG: hypothetical protein V3S00_00710 [Dehalococcoidia bacterium]